MNGGRARSGIRALLNRARPSKLAVSLSGHGRNGPAGAASVLACAQVIIVTKTAPLYADGRWRAGEFGSERDAGERRRPRKVERDDEGAPAPPP